MKYHLYLSITKIRLLKLYLNINIQLKLMSSLVSQCSSKMLLDVGVHHRPEVIKLTVPEQIDDKHLDRNVSWFKFAQKSQTREAKGPKDHASILQNEYQCKKNAACIGSLFSTKKHDRCIQAKRG